MGRWGCIGPAARPLQGARRFADGLAAIWGSLSGRGGRALCASGRLRGGLRPLRYGRFALLPPRPREAISPRFDLASRGRDPRFEAVIIGNSHAAPISPARLTEAAGGVPFASLIAAGGSVEPSLALLRWFLAHRTRPAQAVVIGIDEVWCQEDPRFPASPRSRSGSSARTRGLTRAGSFAWRACNRLSTGWRDPAGGISGQGRPTASGIWSWTLRGSPPGCSGSSKRRPGPEST